MESLRARSRRPRSKNDVLTTGGQNDYYVEPSELNKLLRLFVQARPEQVRPLLLSLTTKKELADLTRRVLLAEMILNGLTYEQISHRTGSGKNTISLVKQGMISNGEVLAKLLNPELNIKGGMEQYLINRLRKGK